MNTDVKLNEKLESIKEEIKKDTSDKIPYLETPSKPVSLEEWCNVIKKHFPDLLFPAEVCASIIAQLFIKDIHNPFGLVLVDVPSSGKTITLNFFSGLEELMYITDKFSPASFVSHAANRKAKDLTSIDLLPRIRHRVLAVRELASIFSDREEDLNKNLGILTRVFDGEGLQTESGVHGQRGYQGDYCFMFLAASTPIQPKVWKAMGNFGSRLFFLEINSKEKSEEQLANQLRYSSWKIKESECRTTTNDFLRTCFSKYPEGVEWNKENDDEDCLKSIGRCAKLLAGLRAPMNIWKEHLGDESLDYTVPIREMPDRINQLLYNLARGHALISGRNHITKDDLKVILEVTFSSAPAKRVKTFKTLLEYNGELKTGITVKALNCSRPTAIKELEVLKILQIVDILVEDDEDSGQEKQVKLKPNFAWFLSEECKKIRDIVLEPTQGQIPLIDHKVNLTPYTL